MCMCVYVYVSAILGVIPLRQFKAVIVQNYVKLPNFQTPTTIPTTDDCDLIGYLANHEDTVYIQSMDI